MWDTTSVPNGRYVIRVIASDAPSNSADHGAHRLAREHGVRRGQCAADDRVGQVRREREPYDGRLRSADADSAVQKAEYSLDGDRWITIYPRDGIADSRVEQFELTAGRRDRARAA